MNITDVKVFNIMNTELALLKFINHYIEHDPVKSGKPYNADQANLVETFGYNMVEKVHPKIFEECFDENTMKLKSKRINDEYVKIPLTPVQILHFKLLYYIVFTKKNYPNKLSKFNFSEDLSELLDNENKITNLYKEFKQIISN